MKIDAEGEGVLIPRGTRDALTFIFQLKIPAHHQREANQRHQISYHLRHHRFFVARERHCVGRERAPIPSLTNRTTCTMKDHQSSEYQSLLENGNPVRASNESAGFVADGVVQNYSSLSVHDGCFGSNDVSHSHQCGDIMQVKSIFSPRCMLVFVSIGLTALLSLHMFFWKHESFTAEQPSFQRSHMETPKHDAIHDILSLHKEPFGFEEAFSSITNEPLSKKSPEELGLPVYNDRPANSLPGSVFGPVQKGTKIGVPLPTNEWYLNLIVGLDDNPGENNLYDNYAGQENRVHSIPYIVDTVGPIVGIRLHYPNIMSYGTVVQSVFVATHGLSLGTSGEGFTRKYEIDPDTLPSKLGIGIRWDSSSQKHKHSRAQMKSRILRGMPYGTMEYMRGVHPVIASEIVADLPLIDGSELHCGKLDPKNNMISEKTDGVIAQKDAELYFPESDFTWLVFFSRPVYVRCFINQDKAAGSVSLPPGAVSSDNPNAFQLHLEDVHDVDEPLIVRVALANNCTSGTNVNFCSQYQPEDQSEFMSVLRAHASVYPTSPFVKYSFFDPGMYSQ